MGYGIGLHFSFEKIFFPDQCSLLDLGVVMNRGVSSSMSHIYALLTKREVQIAGHWASSFLRFYVLRRSRGP